MKKIIISEVLKKDLKLIGYLLASGILGYLSAIYIAKNPALTIVFAPVFNFVLYRITQELKKEGYKEALK